MKTDPSRLGRLSLDRLEGRWMSLAQTSLAAALAWFFANLAFGPSDPPLYAPVAAVVAIGAGRTRRLLRTMNMLGGLALAIAATQVAVNLLGGGTWQMALVVLVTATVATVVFDENVAVSYASFNAAVLVALGGDGWVPDRLPEALLGVGVALAVVYLAPDNPEWWVARRLHQAGRAACDVLDTAAEVLTDGDSGSAAELTGSTVDLEKALSDADSTVDFARELARLSPWLDAETTGGAVDTFEAMRPAFRTVTTVGRLAERVSRDLGASEADRRTVARSLSAVSDHIRAVVETVTGVASEPPEKPAVVDDPHEPDSDRCRALLDEIEQLALEVDGASDTPGTDDRHRFDKVGSALDDELGELR